MVVVGDGDVNAAVAFEPLLRQRCLSLHSHTTLSHSRPLPFRSAVSAHTLPGNRLAVLPCSLLGCTIVPASSLCSVPTVLLPVSMKMPQAVHSGPNLESAIANCMGYKANLSKPVLLQ
ncbi:hypothetical protein PIB30_042434 [Stylosanthes scabra]|uniref:Uncharacterized protein n=1 Tax=Stylosanthes scabra TaxID=79078 RepID=A0ABU6SFK1_9FABA|nr:hypothetical protein [Stylosanthes scabra]